MKHAFFRFGCFNMALTIGIAASTGHKKDWSQERKELFQKGSFYQFMNCFGIILSSFTAYPFFPTFLFFSGITLFSFPLYHKAITQKENLSKKLPPFGGLSMIIGWIWMGIMI